MHDSSRIVAVQAYLQLGDAAFAVPPDLQLLMQQGHCFGPALIYCCCTLHAALMCSKYAAWC